MIRHEQAGDDGPVREALHGVLKRRKGQVVRKHAPPIQHAEGHEIDDVLIPTQLDRNAGRMNHELGSCLY